MAHDASKFVRRSNVEFTAHDRGDSVKGIHTNEKLVN
jgi:hypothetical protein